MKETEIRNIILFSFTRTGTSLARELLKRQPGWTAYAPEKYVGEGVLPLPKEREKFIGAQWGRAAFLFIGAAGIAVRYIAPWVRDKYTDSPVLVMDERGAYVIPLLSGHMGGAAVLADEIADLAGATAVHTTATDVQGRFAVDVFAKENHLTVTDRTAAKEISAAVLDGEEIAFYIEDAGWDRGQSALPEGLVFCRTKEEAGLFCRRIIIARELPSGFSGTCKGAQTTLFLKMELPDIIAGIGCRKGIPAEVLEEGFREILEETGVAVSRVKMLASIDLKKDEPALRKLADTYRLPFVTYPAEELRRVRDVSSGSEFVEKVTGVDNVCERAARLCCADGILLRGKTVRSGMTMALVKCPGTIRF